MRYTRQQASRAVYDRYRWYDPRHYSIPALLVGLTGQFWLSIIIYLVHRHILVNREYNRMNGIIVEPRLSPGQRRALVIAGYIGIALLAVITFVIVGTWFNWMGMGYDAY